MFLTIRVLPRQATRITKEACKRIRVRGQKDSMGTQRLLLTILIACSAITVAEAQQSVEDLPEAMQVLRESAASKTEFTLDHSMLVLASKLDSGNQDLLRVIAGINGVSVHRYRFAEPWGYDLWVHWHNEAISNVAIRIARSNEVDFFEVSGSISPLDLSHLGGHFGIPKIEGGVRVPVPQH